MDRFDSDRLVHFAVAASVIAILVTPQVGFAQNGSVMSGNTKDGLRIKADWQATLGSSGGYIPISIDLTSSRGARDLQLVLHNAAAPGGLDIRQTVHLDNNDPVQFMFLVPLVGPDIWSELRVYEKGVELPSLRLTGINLGGQRWGGEPPSILLISRVAPDWRGVDAAISTLFAVQSQVMQHVYVPPEKAPSNWLELSTIDLVLISLADLEQLSPERRTALTAWSLCGGNLVVFGISGDLERSRLGQVVDFQQRPPAGANWRLPRQEDRYVAAAGTVNPASATFMTWHVEAQNWLNRKDIDGYRSYCRTILQTYGATVSSAVEQNNLAWACVLGPEAVPDMSRIVQIAQRAVANSGREAAYQNTLGVALYRAGRYSEAVDRLQQSIAMGGRGGGPEDWFFLAMAHYKLGNSTQAQQWMDRGERAVTGNAPTKTEWQLFRSEAEAVLAGKDPTEGFEKSQATTATESQRSTADKKITAESAPFAIRPFGFGQLTQIRASSPFTEDVEWNWLFQTIGVSRLRWSERHGMTARAGNWDFWNFLLPDVGQAPVGTFQVLITVFALVIGPLNYFFFKRRKRLYFLIVTVPVLAILTSALLFGYAVASDGFGVRTRTRSVTIIDQSHGEAVSLSRISYYAGLAPAGGLRFPRDTAVFPFDPDDEDPGFRVLDWTDTQNLTSGWLRSRTPMQLLTVSYRPVVEQLAVATDASGAMRITNSLGATIPLVVVCDTTGAMYSAENVAKGVRVTATAQSVEAVREAVRAQLDRQQLVTPPQIIERVNRVAVFPWSVRYRGNKASNNWGSSVLEETLRKFSAAASGPTSFLQPKSYLAIVERPPFVEVGLADAKDGGSLYVIWGSY